MRKRYRKERALKSKYNNSRQSGILQAIDSLPPREVWELCRPNPISLLGLTEEERIKSIVVSRIVVFELLSKRFGAGLLALRGDTLLPLGLKLDYSNPQLSDPIQESYSQN